jgi:hypothetical protein
MLKFRGFPFGYRAITFYGAPFLNASPTHQLGQCVRAISPIRPGTLPVTWCGWPGWRVGYAWVPDFHARSVGPTAVNSVFLSEVRGLALSLKLSAAFPP